MSGGADLASLPGMQSDQRAAGCTLRDSRGRAAQFDGRRGRCDFHSPDGWPEDVSKSFRHGPLPSLAERTKQLPYGEAASRRLRCSRYSRREQKPEAGPQILPAFPKRVSVSRTIRMCDSAPALLSSSRSRHLPRDRDEHSHHLQVDFARSYCFSPAENVVHGPAFMSLRIGFR